MEKRRHEYNQGKKDAVLPFQHAVPAAMTLTNTDYQMKTTRIMNKIIIYLSAVLLLCSCGSARHYAAFQYDNGDDYVSEGLYRIVDRKGRIGYADETGKTVIRPRFAFGYPFEGGKAKVTDSGERKEVAGSGSEHWYWESDDWYYIDKQGNRCENQDTDKDKTHP